MSEASLPGPSSPSSSSSSGPSEGEDSSSSPSSLEEFCELNLQAARCDQLFQRMLRRCLDGQDSLRTECAQIRQSQLVVLNSVQETTQMVSAIHGELAEERAARQAERRERAALREDLRTVSSQMGLLAQGQLEMQRALAAFCTRAAEPAPATPVPAEAAAAVDVAASFVSTCALTPTMTEKTS